MSFGVGLEIKNSFFDRELVARWIGDKAAAALNRAGGYVRRVARNSMKLKGKARKKNTTKLALREAESLPSSPPGKPPFAHSDSNVTTLRNIQYGLSADRESVVIGPLKLNQRSTINGFTGAGTVPALHEFGGTKQVLEKRASKSWVPMGPVRKRRARYPARPYMLPALEVSAPRFPSLFFRSGGSSAEAA